MLKLQKQKSSGCPCVVAYPAMEKHRFPFIISSFFFYYPSFSGVLRGILGKHRSVFLMKELHTYDYGINDTEGIGLVNLK